MGKTAPLPVDLDDVIRSLLDRAGRGLSASQVHVALPRAGRPSRTVVFDRLREMARKGSVQPWPGGKTPLFGTRRFDDHLRERIEAAVRSGPRTEAELRKGVPPAAHALVSRILDDLVREGRAYRHPKLGRKEVVAAAPPEPLPYLAPLVEDAVRKTVKMGFREAEVRAALSRLAGSAPAPARDDPAGWILRTIVELNPRAAEGALVYVPHVRVAVGQRLDKDRFDRTLLALLSQERVQLQAHPVPSQLTPEEREAMVPDGRGSYYMAVGLR